MVLLRIYDFFRSHKKALWASLCGLTVLFTALVFTLRYSEDIGDFLPLGTEESRALDVYQQISGAKRIIMLFSNPDDPDLTVEAIDSFAEVLADADNEGWCGSLQTSFDMQQVQQLMNYVYDNMPYFLDKRDYRRIDSLLAEPSYIRQRLEQDKQVLMMPSGGMATGSIVRDPLGLFAPVMNDLSGANPQLRFENYDGYIFTPDMSRAIVMMTSPFGNSETEGNSKLAAMLEDAAAKVQAEYPDIEIHITGGPVIAVGNSSRIKTDSVIAICLSAVLIILLLVFAFNSVRNILLILLSIGWGWLFAMGGMSIFSSSVSIIVIGISSVILGIAVNYPLHLVAHSAHQKDMRLAIKEISMPLVVGNITTVGAFLALVPLQSVALRDLGIFASLLLVGTILFVLLYLPHFVKTQNLRESRSRMLPYLAAFSPEKYKSVVIAVVLLTAVLSVFSLRTSFDSNLGNINYMTDEQRADMLYFQNLLSNGSSSDTAKEIYVISTGEDFNQALEKKAAQQQTIDSLASLGLVKAHKGVSRFLHSEKEQQEMLERWNSFAQRFNLLYAENFRKEALACGFNASAFEAFEKLLASDFQPCGIEHFQELTKDVLSGNLCTLDKENLACVVDVLSVEKEHADAVKSSFTHSFDVEGMNSALAGNLSDNFNYIGWACSLIVFFFLWFSFGRLELAIISFLPMAISWIWILGLMSILGIQFNIVNVILATFIFGQGDDYTIFMTEGCQYEYTHRRPILASYKSSIIQSALIMFVGIGTLIVAKHPAMRSLAQVTIIGMFSVVLMAYLVPPLLFKWLTTKKGVARMQPITLANPLGRMPKDPADQVYGRYIYKGSDITRSVKRNLKAQKARLAALQAENGIICINDDSYGELAIFAALTHPQSRVRAIMSDADRMEIARISADGFVKNIEFVNSVESI